jgi:hypothetical protein
MIEEYAMSTKTQDSKSEPSVKWNSGGENVWIAQGRTSSYRIALIPKPVDRWVVDIDGRRELLIVPDSNGDTLRFWYKKDAQKHCHEKEYGRTGFAESPR